MSEQDEQRKLDDMQLRINALKAKQEPKTSELDAEHQTGESMSGGMQASTELVGPIIGAGLMGYAFDEWLGTKPWGLVILLLLGVATGFFNVWKMTQKMNTPLPENATHKDKKKSLANED